MADEEDELARINLQAHIVERRLVRLGGIDLGEMLHQDDGLDAGLTRHLRPGFAHRGEHQGEVGILQRALDRLNLTLLGCIRRGNRRARMRHEDAGGRRLGGRRNARKRRGDRGGGDRRGLGRGRDRIRTRCGRCLRGRGCELIRRRIGKGIVCMLGSGSESARLRGCLSLDVRSDGIRRGRLGRLGRCLLVSGLTEVVTHW